MIFKITDMHMEDKTAKNGNKYQVIELHGTKYYGDEEKQTDTGDRPYKVFSFGDTEQTFNDLKNFKVGDVVNLKQQKFGKFWKPVAATKYSKDGNGSSGNSGHSGSGAPSTSTITAMNNEKSLEEVALNNSVDFICGLLESTENHKAIKKTATFESLLEIVGTSYAKFLSLLKGNEDTVVKSDSSEVQSSSEDLEDPDIPF